jgi:hypothetical protein
MSPRHAHTCSCHNVSFPRNPLSKRRPEAHLHTVIELLNAKQALS